MTYNWKYYIKDRNPDKVTQNQFCQSSRKTVTKLIKNPLSVLRANVSSLCCTKSKNKEGRKKIGKRRKKSIYPLETSVMLKMDVIIFGIPIKVRLAIFYTSVHGRLLANRFDCDLNWIRSTNFYDSSFISGTSMSTFANICPVRAKSFRTTNELDRE